MKKQIATLLLMALLTVPFVGADGPEQAEPAPPTDGGEGPGAECVDVVPYPPYVVVREQC